MLLASVDLFTTRECGITRESRERLLRLLDLYGISFAIAQLASKPTLATGELVRMLFQASGFPRLRQTLDHAFRWRTDAIKAGWALSSLEKIASHAERPADRELLRDAIERVLQQPESHRLRLLEVAQLVTTGAVDLPDQMEGELTRLALSNDPGWILNLPRADRRPDGPGRVGRRDPVAGLRRRRCQPVPVAGRARRAPRLLPAVPTYPWPSPCQLKAPTPRSRRCSRPPTACVSSPWLLL